MARAIEEVDRTADGHQMTIAEVLEEMAMARVQLTLFAYAAAASRGAGLRAERPELP
jgi:hypothetical protein